MLGITQISLPRTLLGKFWEFYMIENYSDIMVAVCNYTEKGLHNI